MSDIPVPGRQILVRLARLFAITLTFVSVGPPILMTLEVCYSAISAIANGWTFNIASQFTWQLATMLMGCAGLTGLIGGICEMLFRRINARTMFAISLVNPFSLIICYLLLPPLLNFTSTGKIDALQTFAVPLAIGLLSFAASMLSCWKITEMAWGKTPAVDTAQVFD